MTKILPLTLLCTLLCTSLLTAQSSKNFTLSAGIGLTPVYQASDVHNETPAVSVQIGYDFTKSFNLSAFAGYTAATSDLKVFSDGLASQVENKTTALGLRGEFRKAWTDRFEVYGGLVVGYKKFDITEFDPQTGEPIVRAAGTPTPYNPNAAQGQVMYAGFVGSKLFLTKHIGAYGELGYGLALVTVGATFRL